MLAAPNQSLVVIGGASVDRLHFGGRSQRSIGGAGLYTALAAHRAGVSVTMVGPRPHPLPAEFAEFEQRVDWRGPEVTLERMPSFEIVHDGAGGSRMISSAEGAEADLDPEQLPADLPAGPAVVIGLVDPELQLGFARRLKADGRPVACGSYLGAIHRDRSTCLEILEVSDVFFCNHHEAEALASGGARLEAAGRLVFVTRGRDGVTVLQGDHVTEVPAADAEELDPTGAGDTFCGTVVAELMSGRHPVMAARRGVAASAAVVGGVGPAELLAAKHRFEPAEDCRAVLDADRIERMATIFTELSSARPFDFVGDLVPAVGDPTALDFFFAVTLQQFGFWRTRNERYFGPVLASVGGQELKGSDFLWAVYHRWRSEHVQGLTATAQAEMTAAEMSQRLRADDGSRPLEETGSADYRAELARAYARTLAELGLDPVSIVDRANDSPRPLATFLATLDHVGGYREDPLRKKAALLAMILMQRPERFLRPAVGEELPPVVDYHVQRSCLRTGMVRIADPELRRRIEERRVVPADEEWAVRNACYRAVDGLRARSGRSMGAIDWFLFQNRMRCPEMTEPDCERCPLDPDCAHDKALFQPVFRTDAY